MEDTHEIKKLRYADLGEQAEQQGWNIGVHLVEEGCSGFKARSAVSVLRELGVQGQSLHNTAIGPYPLLSEITTW